MFLFGFFLKFLSVGVKFKESFDILERILLLNIMEFSCLSSGTDYSLHFIGVYDFSNVCVLEHWSVESVAIL